MAGNEDTFGICPVGSPVEYSSFLVKGDEVGFTRSGDGRKSSIPESFLMLHDITRKHFRRCDFYIVEHVELPDFPIVFDEQTVEEAQNYYGKAVKLAAAGIALPDASWKSVGVVDEITYRRHPSDPQPFLSEKVGGRYYHPYKPAVALYEARPGHGWRASLPEGCIVNAHGFVRP